MEKSARPETTCVGLAGWANPPAHQSQRRSGQSHLEYYAERFGCVEINSSFYRAHRNSTYAAWQRATPAAFRFAVKMPRSITHDGGLHGVQEDLDAFFSSIEALQPKLGAVLIQLPPSFEFSPRIVRAFFKTVPRLPGCHLVCEPRHATWFTGSADRLLEGLRVSRVAADPAPVESAERPGGDGRFRYFRWHGSPRKYYSSYSDEQLARFAGQLNGVTPAWCIFDNTARHAAWNNALAFRAATC